MLLKSLVGEEDDVFLNDESLFGTRNKQIVASMHRILPSSWESLRSILEITDASAMILGSVPSRVAVDASILADECGISYSEAYCMFWRRLEQSARNDLLSTVGWLPEDVDGDFKCVVDMGHDAAVDSFFRVAHGTMEGMGIGYDYGYFIRHIDELLSGFGWIYAPLNGEMNFHNGYGYSAFVVENDSAILQRVDHCARQAGIRIYVLSVH